MQRNLLNRSRWAAAGVLISLGLTACGGSDNGSAEDPVAANQVPASAQASASAYTRFAAGLSPNETGVGLDVNQTTPPTSETEAPQAI